VTGRSARPSAGSIVVLAAILAIVAAACGAAPFTSPASSAVVPVGPVAPGVSVAPGDTATPGDSATPGESTPSDEPGVAAEQIGGKWRRAPIQLADSQVAVVSDACAAKARQTLGEAEADLPTATVDARGEGIVTAILSDDAAAIVCAARMDGAGNAIVDSVDRLATTSFEPQDGNHVGLTELVRLDDPPGVRTLAYGRVGPDPAQVKLGFPDQSTLVASRDNGWWLAWWPGAQRTNAIAGVDTHSVVVGSAVSPADQVESRLGSASWWLDPTKVAPGPNDTVVPIKILEAACASGSPGLDRLDPPTIDLTDTTIVVTLAIKRQAGAQDCQGNVPFSFDLELPEPLMNRALLDGSENPPRDVSKPPSG
jgi:hypothetical protein